MDTQSPGIRLKDILDAIAGLRSFAGDMSFGEYLEDLKTRWAVRHALLNISEAVRHLPTDMTDRFPEIPWHDIRAIGNRLRHEYRWVDDAILWPIATREIDHLEAAVQNLLDELGRAGAERDANGDGKQET